MKYRMVDQILAWEPWRSIRGIKTVSFEEYTAKRRLGCDAGLPRLLMLESAIQLGRWLAILSSDFDVTVLPEAFDRCTWESALRPGQRLRLDLAVRDRHERGMLVDVVGRVGPREVLRVERLAMRSAPLADYDDGGDLRVMFSELHRPETAGVP